MDNLPPDGETIIVDVSQQRIHMQRAVLQINHSLHVGKLNPHIVLANRPLLLGKGPIVASAVPW